MRKALLIGLGTYEHLGVLSSRSDVERLRDLLSTHSDSGDSNFECQVEVDERGSLIASEFVATVDRFLSGDADVALLVFSGHAALVDGAPYFLLPGFRPGDPVSLGRDAVAMQEVAGLVRSCDARAVVVVLDCCHGGAFGRAGARRASSALDRTEVVVLASSQPGAEAFDRNGRSLFAELLADALEGSAADLVGKVTVASTHAYLDASFGALHAQRPVMQANVSRRLVLRETPPAVEPAAMRRLVSLFRRVDEEHLLDPSYVVGTATFDPINGERMTLLRRFRDAHLVKPVGFRGLEEAARGSGGCALTRLGQHWWTRVDENRL